MQALVLFKKIVVYLQSYFKNSILKHYKALIHEQDGHY